MTVFDVFTFLILAVFVPLVFSLFIGYLVEFADAAWQLWVVALTPVWIYLEWMHDWGYWPGTLFSWQALLLAIGCLVWGVITICASTLDWSGRYDDDTGKDLLTISDINR